MGGGVDAGRVGRMSRSVRNAAVALVLMCVAGFTLSAAAGGRLGLEVAGMIVLGLAGIGLVAGAFFLVGASEDRDRERSDH